MPAPPVSALAHLKRLNPELVHQIRERFLNEVQNNIYLYEPADLEQIRNNDWQVQRFLLECKLNMEQTYESLRNAMRWRKEQGIHQIMAEDFPIEFYQSGYICRYGRDINDATVIYFRANIHRKTIEWSERLKKFFIYQIKQIDQDSDGKGVTLVIDCSDVGVSNVDMDLLKFVVTSFSKYYPKLFDAIIIHQLPFLLQYIFKLVTTWLPEDDRKFFHLTTKKTLIDFICIDQWPSFLNGNNMTTNESWKSLPIYHENPILPVKQFVQHYGYKFNLKDNDEKKLDYLKAFI